MDEFDRIIAQAQCIVNSDKVVDEIEKMKSTIDQQDKLIAAAEQRGYERALDEVIDKLTTLPKADEVLVSVGISTAITKVQFMKSEYLRQEGKNGKTE